MRFVSLLVVALTFPLAANALSCAPSIPVTMTLSSNLSQSVPSASIGLHVALQNQSSTIVNGQLFVTVTNSTTRSVVDRFLAPEGITLLANSAGKSDFVLKIPNALPSGAYAVEATFVANGTTRADAVAGADLPTATTSIEILDGVDEPSITAVHVNGSSYDPGAPVLITGNSAEVVAATVNGSKIPLKGSLTWRLYAADATLSDQPIDTTQSPVELHPGYSTDAQYTLSDTTHQAYYLEGDLSNGATHSYIDIWLTRDPMVFSELSCVTKNGPLTSNGPVNTRGVVYAIAAILALALLWRIYEMRRA